MREKIGHVIETLYGFGVIVCLLGGGILFFGFIYAFIVGQGGGSADICVYIHKTIFPKLIYLSNILIVMGLVKMYIVGEKTLTAGNRRSKEKMAEIDE